MEEEFDIVTSKDGKLEKYRGSVVNCCVFVWVSAERLTDPGSQQFNTIHKREVSDRDERTKNRSCEQDDDRRVAQLSLAGPGGLFEFGQRLLVEETNA